MNNFEKLVDSGAFENMDKQIEESDKRYVQMLKTGLLDYNLRDIERLKDKKLLNNEEVLLYSTIEMSVRFGDWSNKLVKILNSKKDVKTISDFEHIVNIYESTLSSIKSSLGLYISLNNDITLYVEDY